MNQQNWAGNYTYRAVRLHTPETVEQVQEIVARSKQVKALGSRHSFNNIADTNEDLIAMERLDRVLAIDTERRTVTVEGGIKYGTLCRELHRQGYALHNLASLPHISIAGACATATHGSGVTNGNLATAVSALEIVIASGEKVTLSRENKHFQGAVVGIGALGMVTSLTLDIEPTYEVRQDVYENLPLPQLEAHFEEIVSSAYSVSLFTDWNGDCINQVWRKSRVSGTGDSQAEPVWFGATLAARSLHPLASMSPVNCTEQLGVPGPWHERLPHFRMEFTPSAGEELQTEYLIPYANALQAIHAIQECGEAISPLLLISEVRTIAADTFWMSPCYQQPCIGIHFTWKKDWSAVRDLLPLIESRLEPFQARPHWGKLFTTSPSHLPALYPKLPEFCDLVRSCDPEGKFRNEFLADVLPEAY